MGISCLGVWEKRKECGEIGMVFGWDVGVWFGGFGCDFFDWEVVDMNGMKRNEFCECWR